VQQQLVPINGSHLRVLEQQEEEEAEREKQSEERLNKLCLRASL
jgi:hypothetical protein